MTANPPLTNEQIALVSVLKKYWGYDTFRPMQREIIESVLAGRDTLALLPTGGGKSLCFQLPALLMEGMCLVVSPLIALMNDQVAQLRQRHLTAAAIVSGKSRRSIDKLLDHCIYGQVKFLYVAPERLKNELFITRLRQMKVSLLAVDEAHCISQWGYDFRPAYLEISNIYAHLPGVKRIALTATATAEVKRDIFEKLSFRSATTFQKSFARSNLSYSAFQLSHKEEKLLKILQSVPGSALVYVRSRSETQHVAQLLNHQGIASDFYHAGLEAATRTQKQSDWMNNARRVMVATNAFGMGIDKPDVRLVVHLGLPDSLEAYYQEAGRAGRDEKKAYAVLLYDETDLDQLRVNHALQHPTLEYVQRTYQAIAGFLKLAIGSGQWQSYDFDLKQMAFHYGFPPKSLHFAVRKLQEMGVLLLSEDVSLSSQAKFAISSSAVYEYIIAHASLEPLIKALLRLYGGGLYDELMNISEVNLSRLTPWTTSEVEKKLRFLDQSGILMYEPVKTLPQLTYLTPRLDAAALKPYYRALLPRQQVIKEKVEAMMRYATDTKHCRTLTFQTYFDEKAALHCGACDMCLNQKRKQDTQEEIRQAKKKIRAYEWQDTITIQTLKATMDIKDDVVFSESVRQLVDEGTLTLVAFQNLKKAR